MFKALQGDGSNIIPITFKILLGTILFCVIFVVAFEYFNVTKRTLELANMSRTIMERSCRFFSKESYRGSKADIDTRNVDLSFGNSYGIKDTQGKTMVSGRFYEGDSEEDVYNKLFDIDNNDNARAYIEWLDTELQNYDGDFNKEDNLTYSLLYNSLTNDTTKPLIGNSQFVTPLNLGFTYLDKDVLLRIFKWKLVNELSAISANSKDYTKRDRFFKDEQGRTFLKWYGFRIYYNEIEVDINYERNVKLYDLNNPDDRIDLMNWTGIVFKQEDMENYEQEGYLDRNKILENSNDIRRFKVLYDVNWSVPISYEGILPINMVLGLMTGDEHLTYSVFTDAIPFLPDYQNPINIKIDNSTRMTTLQSTKDVFKSNEVFIGGNNEGRFNIGNNNDLMGNRQSRDGTKFRYDSNNQSKYLGDGKDETLGFAQNLHFCIIH